MCIIKSEKIIPRHYTNVPPSQIRVFSRVQVFCSRNTETAPTQSRKFSIRLASVEAAHHRALHPDRFPQILGGIKLQFFADKHVSLSDPGLSPQLDMWRKHPLEPLLRGRVPIRAPKHIHTQAVKNATRRLCLPTDDESQIADQSGRPCVL